MRTKIECRGPSPGAFDRDILKGILDELADARRAADMRDDLQEEVRCGERRCHCGQIRSLVFIAHRPGRDAHRSVVERTDERVDLGLEARARKLFGETPKLATTGD